MLQIQVMQLMLQIQVMKVMQLQVMQLMLQIHVMQLIVLNPWLDLTLCFGSTKGQYGC